MTLDTLATLLARTMARRWLLSLALVSSVIFASPCRGSEQPHAQGRSLQQVYAELRALFRRYYPDVKSEASSDTIHFEYDTRAFSIHEPLKIGERQGARDVRGPKRGGILCDVELRKGRYLGTAAVPQTFDERSFKVLVAAPYSVDRDEHLYVHLYYPADVSADFLRQFSRVVGSFAR